MLKKLYDMEMGKRSQITILLLSKSLQMGDTKSAFAFSVDGSTVVKWLSLAANFLKRFLKPICKDTKIIITLVARVTVAINIKFIKIAVVPIMHAKIGHKGLEMFEVAAGIKPLGKLSLLFLCDPIAMFAQLKGNAHYKRSDRFYPFAEFFQVLDG